MGSEMCIRDRPRDIHFELRLTAINADHFLIADLEGDEYRHVMFGTHEDLLQLPASSNWYMDGTFKVVREPFYKVFTIHAFTERAGHEAKQFRRVYVMMSRRQTSDYDLVLR